MLNPTVILARLRLGFPTSRTGCLNRRRQRATLVCRANMANHNGVSSKLTQTASGVVDCTYLQYCQKKTTPSATAASVRSQTCATARKATPHLSLHRPTHCAGSFSNVAGMLPSLKPLAKSSSRACKG